MCEVWYPHIYISVGFVSFWLFGRTIRSIKAKRQNITRTLEMQSELRNDYI